MKLYTEEQVKQAMDGFSDCDCTMDDVINRLIPIELPSNEEIEKLEKKYLATYGDNDNTAIGVKIGCLWMRDKILNQNK